MSKDLFPNGVENATEVKLATGASMPLMGFGTWKATTDEVSKAVEVALKNGVRHIDCAWAYDNEEAVGNGIRASGIDRKDIFVTTKLWSTFHRRVEQGLDASLARLGLDYVDLYLMHWPVALNVRGDEKIPLRDDGSRDVDTERNFTQTWSDMEKLLQTGKTRAIGVSNVSEALMDELLAVATVKPAVNQLESHPYLPEHDLMAYMHAKGIAPQAYSPLGSGAAPVLQDECITTIAKAHGVDPAQIALSWQVQRGVTVLPKSVTESRIKSNAHVVKLTDDEMRQINELHRQPGKHVRLGNPPWGVDLKFKVLPHK